MDRTHIGKTCPYCQFPLKADSEVVVCAACRIPHHRECWAENGGCTTFGCGGLTVEQRNQPGIMQTTIATEVGQEVSERLVVSLDESPLPQMPGLARSLAYSATTNGQLASGQDIYQLTYRTGDLSLQDLPIGDQVIDPTWLWEFRTGNSYSGEGEVKAVTWIVVAKDHYGHQSGVTLMSEEIIGKYCFENREGVLALMKTGLNHWEDSSSNTQGERLRSWLNATGIHSSEAFCKAFSNNFKQAVLITNLPNKDWKNGNIYRTWDRVFIPSTTELGDPAHRNTHRIGSIYPYYREANNANRTAKAGSRNWWYWTRSPNFDNSKCVCNVDTDGTFRIDYASCSDIGVRPALNLKADTLVSKI